MPIQSLALLFLRERLPFAQSRRFYGFVAIGGPRSIALLRVRLRGCVAIPDAELMELRERVFVMAFPGNGRKERLTLHGNCIRDVQSIEEGTG